MSQDDSRRRDSARDPPASPQKKKPDGANPLGPNMLPAGPLPPHLQPPPTTSWTESSESDVPLPASWLPPELPTPLDDQPPARQVPIASPNTALPNAAPPSSPKIVTTPAATSAAGSTKPRQSASSVKQSAGVPARLKSPDDKKPGPPSPAKAGNQVLVQNTAEPDTDEEMLPFDMAGAAVRSSPPFLVSMFVHLILVVSLGLISFSQATTPELKIEATYAETLGEQLIDDSVMTNPLETLESAPTTDPILSVDASSASNPLATVPDLTVQLEGAGGGVGAGLDQPGLGGPAIGLALTGREKGARGGLLAAYGGTATTESSVGLALEWLRRNQQRDGSWSLTGPFASSVTVENRTAATALALIAFLGNGHTTKSTTHGEAVHRGMQALLKMQDADGLFFHEGESNQRMYSQAMATIAVCELYGMTKDEQYRKPAQRALNYAAKVQADDGRGGGGWRYQPREDVDTSVTGWFVMAFQSARMSGLEGYSPVLEKVSLYLDHVTKDGINYQYRFDEGERISMTAEALLCRQYLGWQRDDPRLVEGVRKILENPIKWDEPNFYYWYYATQVLHHMGGDEWDAWNKVMREQLPKHQIKAGRERGSWSPEGDPYGYKGGPMYSTCFCTFMLEVYYRHLPIYRHK